MEEKNEWRIHTSNQDKITGMGNALFLRKMKELYKIYETSFQYTGYQAIILEKQET